MVLSLEKRNVTSKLLQHFSHIWSRALAAGEALTTEKGSIGLP